MLSDPSSWTCPQADKDQGWERGGSGETSHTAVAQLSPSCAPGLRSPLRGSKNTASDREKEMNSQCPLSIPRIKDASIFPVRARSPGAGQPTDACCSIIIPRKQQQYRSTQRLLGKGLLWSGQRHLDLLCAYITRGPSCNL